MNNHQQPCLLPEWQGRWGRSLAAGLILLTGAGMQAAGSPPAQAGRAVATPDRSPYPGQSQDPRGDWDRDGAINGMDPDDDNDGVPDFEDPEPYSRMPARGGARKPEPDPL